MVILNQVLQEVYSFLGLDLIYFDQILQREEQGSIRGKIQGMVKGFLACKSSTFTQTKNNMNTALSHLSVLVIHETFDVQLSTLLMLQHTNKKSHPSALV